ncbi:MAG: hypothetical protein GU361_01550 [Desulfurococcales archaeon]|nr:hypothetical protein [Desulfurococcales archaeon]
MLDGPRDKLPDLAVQLSFKPSKLVVGDTVTVKLSLLNNGLAISGLFNLTLVI